MDGASPPSHLEGQPICEVTSNYLHDQIDCHFAKKIGEAIMSLILPRLIKSRLFIITRQELIVVIETNKRARLVPLSGTSP